MILFLMTYLLLSCYNQWLRCYIVFKFWSLILTIILREHPTLITTLIRIFRSHNTKQLLCSWHVEIENVMFISWNILE